MHTGASGQGKSINWLTVVAVVAAVLGTTGGLIGWFAQTQAKALELTVQGNKEALADIRSDVGRLRSDIEQRSKSVDHRIESARDSLDTLRSDIGTLDGGGDVGPRLQQLDAMIASVQRELGQLRLLQGSVDRLDLKAAELEKRCEALFKAIVSEPGGGQG